MSVDVGLNADDQRNVDKANQQNKEYQDKLALAFGETFRSQAGRFVLSELRDRCNVDSTCIRDCKHPDVNAVMFEEGKRAVYNYILFYLRHDNERRKQQ